MLDSKRIMNIYSLIFSKLIKFYELSIPYCGQDKEIL